jgi:hypothetical protein
MATVTNTYRPPRKRKPVAIERPRIVTSVPVRKAAADGR